MTFDVILMCGGQQTRMGGACAPPKQMTPINGVPLIERTARMCKLLGAEHVLGVANFKAPGCDSVVAPTENLFLEEMLLHLPKLHGDTQIVLCGDTVFSYAVLRTLIFARQYAFAVRYVPNIFTGRDCAELYGFTLPAEAVHNRGHLLAHVSSKRAELTRLERSADFDDATVRAVRERNFRPWGLMHALVDTGTAVVHEVAWEDYTDDIDDPTDLTTLPFIERVVENV